TKKTSLASARRRLSPFNTPPLWITEGNPVIPTKGETLLQHQLRQAFLFSKRRKRDSVCKSGENKKASLASARRRLSPFNTPPRITESNPVISYSRIEIGNRIICSPPQEANQKYPQPAWNTLRRFTPLYNELLLIALVIGINHKRH